MPVSPSFRRGIRDAIPILLAVGAFGVAFGVLAVEVGLSPWLALLTSVIVVSGAAQFALVGLVSTGTAPVLIAVTGLGLRHLPMSATLARLIGPQPLSTRLRLAFILVDETFGLTVHAARRGEPDLVAYKSAADLMLYVGWLAGTAVGAWFGGAVDPAAVGLDVLFGLMFLGLAVPLVRRRRDWVVAALAVAATLAATELLPAAWRLTGAAASAALVGAMLHE
ncbi:MAG TPA: AzlC family ABC transporter permease [Acidimicrobiia bacterium]|nr:AzlC family ABC transporter permease [Acidimicrobiia bacterium]